MMWYLYRRCNRAGNRDDKTLAKMAQSRDEVHADLMGGAASLSRGSGAFGEFER